MKDINKENYLQKLFIDEAKPSINRFERLGSQIGGLGSKVTAMADHMVTMSDQMYSVNEQIAGLEKRIEALEPMGNYFDMSVFRNETSPRLTVYGTEGQPSMIQVDSSGFTTTQPFSAFCPEAKVGKTYTLSVHATGRWSCPGGGSAWVTLDYSNGGETLWRAPNWSEENLDSEGAYACTFVLTQEILNGHICFDIPEAMDYSDDDGDGMWENIWYPTYEEFDYFQMSEGEESKPYEPYEG